ncbi:unnamed protein product [Nippostrongylus brasiliensis]|uniref:SCP domain-containing protein n=1 Tax=Nippostrongylus brasiliensis TaxID=27835 RepID=A0A0N4YBA9_NIPBR|nr:unnamed protein product [Nippostrongylus brasiliensis]
MISDFNCPSNLGQGDDTRAEFLKRHNNIRQNIAVGMLPVNLFAYFLGPAKNMYKLEWSCDLERIAKATIDKCQFKNVSTKYVYSTNKFAHSGFENVRAIEEAVYEWVQQIQMNDFGPKFQCHDKIREFCNMAYPTNTRVGCAYERCENDLLISCAYEEGKPVPFNPLLEVAAHYCVCKHYPDSNCDEDFMCTTKRNTTIEPLGPATIKTTTPTRATTTTAATPKLDVPKASCPHLKNVMTDKVRQVFLDTHNKWRSLVAKGKAEDPLSPGGYAPKASQMVKLCAECNSRSIEESASPKRATGHPSQYFRDPREAQWYDCTLEESSKQVAEKCKHQHSYGDYGENLFAGSFTGWDHDEVAEMAVDQWAGELKRFGVGDNLTYPTPDLTGHYAQVVWQHSTRVGCYINDKCFPDSPGWKTQAVCQYKPRGLRYTWEVYWKGEPCKKDSDCACYQCSCLADEGLCYDPNSMTQN